MDVLQDKSYIIVISVYLYAKRREATSIFAAGTHAL